MQKRLARDQAIFGTLGKRNVTKRPSRDSTNELNQKAILATNSLDTASSSALC
jgi:hypothetical protein